MAPTTHDTEIDSLSHLEERIQRAVELVNRLRQEKETALKDLAATRQTLDESQTSNSQLADEIEALRTERQQVRSRIEKLLGHIDQLGAA
jgi:FtsZ-binding cell division protein ZapB